MIKGFFYFLTLLALVLAVVALAINLWMVRQVLAFQRELNVAVDRAIAAVDDLADEEFRYDYRLQQTIPFSGEVPIRQDVVIPVHTSVPISTVLQIAVATPVGQVEVPVPVQLEVPIDTEVALRVDQTVQLDVRVPIDTVLHLRFKMNEPPFREALQSLRAWLIQFRSSGTVTEGGGP